MAGLSLGSIVRCREREWILLPSPSDDLILLRPLTGGEDEICGISRRLSDLGIDRVTAAAFPLPTPADARDEVSARLLWNAARLSLRDGAGPLRSLGRLSVRPRPYQFVPLLMALRLATVRLLIADDVGIGKTIEAGLIARELLDRGEIHRLCVLCPPYLCEQWKTELWDKFRIDAVVVRSGTVGQLDKEVPPGLSVFGHYPYLVVSIDYAKSERHRANFALHAPELVIVDEAHGAARPAGDGKGQQQRHELLQMLARQPERHLILLTATPHSGVEESFLSLLALLGQQFGRLNLQALTEEQRRDLADHFVQRRRADVKRWLGEETPFPDRLNREETYDLSPEYQNLFKRIYDFSSDLVRTSETLSGWRKRVRYWTALAVLRCVMSSPAAAVATLERRAKGQALSEEGALEDYEPYIFEPTDDEPQDAQPAALVGESDPELGDTDRRRLASFVSEAKSLLSGDKDSKVLKCVQIIRKLLQEGRHPIVWCRYIATSDYVASQLQQRLAEQFRNLRVVSVTGNLPDDVREAQIKEIRSFDRRVLVATDCLSEGVNLQEDFDAVVHYDLPWNPNRLEQREGRIDRYGQRQRVVKTFLLYGRDNPIDGAVLDVLLRKAREIHRTLGVSVPVPVDSETVMEAVLKALFHHSPGPSTQLSLFSLFDQALVKDVHHRWDDAVRRETESRTRFAQRTINPDVVARELEEMDAVLGDPQAVQAFVLNAVQRLGMQVQQLPDGAYRLGPLDRLPALVQDVSPGRAYWDVAFDSATPRGATYLGRNHPFVAGLAQYMLESALTQSHEAVAPRCGVLRTAAVGRRTILLLLRLRFAIEESGSRPLLAEEVFVCGFRGRPPDSLDWIAPEEAVGLLDVPGLGSIPLAERRENLSEALAWWPELQTHLAPIIEGRAAKLQASHRRVRAAARLAGRTLSVRPYFPPDLLGLLVLQPVAKGVSQ